MARRLIDSVSGIGSVHAGDVLLRGTRYQLSFWANDDTQPQSGKRTSVDGHIDIAGIAEAAVLSGCEKLTLTLGDGRRIDFRLKTTSGEVIGVEES